MTKTAVTQEDNAYNKANRMRLNPWQRRLRFAFFVDYFFITNNRTDSHYSHYSF